MILHDQILNDCPKNSPKWLEKYKKVFCLVFTVLQVLCQVRICLNSLLYAKNWIRKIVIQICNIRFWTKIVQKSCSMNTSQAAYHDKKYLGLSNFIWLSAYLHFVVKLSLEQGVVHKWRHAILKSQPQSTHEIKIRHH